jgi:hypothetical protein
MNLDYSTSHENETFKNTSPENYENTYDYNPTSHTNSFSDEPDDPQFNLINLLTRLFLKDESKFKRFRRCLNLKNDVNPFPMSAKIQQFMHIYERMLCFKTILEDCKSFDGIAACVVLFLKDYFPASIVLTIMKKFHEMFNVIASLRTFDNQADTPDTEPRRKRAFQLARDLFSQSKAFRKSPIAEKVMEFISYLIAVGFCGKDNSLEFSVQGMTMFQIEAKKQPFIALDFAEHVFEILTFFIEKGFECFDSKSLNPLLFSDTAALKYEKEYAVLMSALPLLEVGCLEKLSMNEHDFDLRLNALIDLTQQMINECGDKFVRNVINAKYVQLIKLRGKLVMCQHACGLRIRPYSVLFYGKSGVGKSMLTTTVISYLRKINKLPGGLEKVVTLNACDKFQSEFRTCHDTVILDDIANGTPATTDGNPTTLLIDYINNIAKCALSPEAGNKGKIQIRPKFVIGTTNIKHMDAAVYSSEPLSVARRFDKTVTVTVKPEYCLPNSHMVDPTKVPLDALITDIWSLCVERVVPIPSGAANGKDSIGYEIIESKDGVDYSQCSLYEFLALIGAESKDHFLRQEKLVKSNSNIFDEELCEHNTFKCLCPTCKFLPKTMENQVGTYGPDGEIPYINPMDAFWADCRANHNNIIQACIILYSRRIRWNRWFSWIPTESTKGTIFENCIFTLIYRFMGLNPCYWFFAASFGLMNLFGYFWLSVPMFWFNAFSHALGFAVYEKYRMQLIMKILEKGHNSISLALTRFRRKRSQHLFVIGGAVAACYGFYKIYKKFHPTKIEEEDKADQSLLEKIRVFPKPEFNPWASAKVEPVIVSAKSKSISFLELSSLVIKNQMHMKIAIGDGTMAVCNAFFVNSNYAIIPNHVVRDEEKVVTFTRSDPANIGPNFVSYVGRSNTINIVGTDLAVIYLPQGGSNKCLTQYFPENAPDLVIGELIYKDAQANVKQFRSRCLFMKDLRNQSAQFPGHSYSLEENTFNGLCCATWVANTANPYIFGFHLGGFANSPIGCSGFISRNSIIEYVDRLSEQMNIRKSVSSGVFMTQTYGIDFTPIGEIDEKSPVNFLKENSTIKCFGKHPIGGVRPKSDVVSTMISDTVTEVMGQPNIWGSPSFTRQPRWQPWQMYLEGAALQKIGFPPSVTLSAYKDYYDGVHNFIDKNLHVLQKVYVLNDIETVSGIDGFKFVDRMKANTSVGWPINKPKKNFIIDLEEKVENIALPQNIDNMFWEEARRMEECYINDERAYPVFRSALKDEPSKLTKSKSRVFQAASIALQLILRKYFLTIAHIISKNPEIFECAVGLNCTGPEWDGIVRHMTKYGEDRVVAGDFKAFDQKMPAEFVLLSFEIMISIAERAGYDERSLKIMKGVSSDVAYPMIEINGEFVELFGSNPSGQNLTVYTNSIANSLYHRCAYYTIFKGRKVPPFQEVMSIMTYGDDVKGSVKEGYDELNHTSIAAALSTVGIEYTMADKTSTSVAFINNKDACFLKRNVVWNTEANCWFGALEEDSIMKSLHSVVRSKACSKVEVAVQNIDGALREYFFHGKEVYEDRLEKLKEVARRTDLTTCCTGLHLTYEDRMAAWKELYQPPELSVV